MDKKITRRAVLGTVMGGLVVAPFLVRAFRKPLELVENPDMKEFRERYQTALDFPRTFDPFGGNNILPGRERDGFREMMLPLFRSHSKENQNKALEIQRRYWNCYARLDEVEFDYTNYTYHEDGRKRTDDNFAMSAHVWLKYGYGMEIQGEDVSGQQIHWVFNMDGKITLPTVQEMNLSSMFRTFFDLNSAIPENVVLYGEIVEGVELPENPHVTGRGKYDQVEMPRITNLPDRLRKYRYARTYYSRTTGMPELVIRSDLDGAEEKEFLEGKIDNPKQNFRYEVSRYSQFDGVIMPIEQTLYYGSHQGGKPSWQQTYSGVAVRLLKG